MKTDLGQLGHHYLKLAGIMLAALVMVLILLYTIADVVLLPAMRGNGYGSLLLLVMIFGLYISAMARERQEDERVKIIRGKAITISFVVIMGNMIAFGVTILVSNKIHEGIPLSTCLIPPVFALIVYHVLFYIGIYRDSMWDYTDGVGMPTPPTKKDRTITYSIIAVLLLLFLLVTYFIKSDK